jgi:hypothetical protein
MASLAQPSAAYVGDRGEPDPALRALLTRAGDHEGYLRAIAALCGSRLLLAVVAFGDDGGERPDPERQAELRAAMLRTQDGRTALPAFTGLDALVAWRADARPVPCRLDEVATSAVEAGCVAVLIDLAGPASVVIEGDLLAELAQGRRLVELDGGGWAWLFADLSESRDVLASPASDNSAEEGDSSRGRASG